MRRRCLRKLKILITGAEGCLGKPLVQFLKSRGWEVVATDIVGDAEYLDVTDEANVLNVFRRCKPNVVVHYAARAEPCITSFADVSEDVIVNILGTRNVLEGCKEVGAKLIYASSAAVYGDLYMKTRKPISEDDNVEPVNPYGVDKAAAENYIRLYARNFGVDYVILRFGNVYSWNDRKYLLWNLFKAVTEKKQFKLYGGGEMVRDFVYVEDVNELVEKLLTAASCDVFNVGHEPLRIKDVVREVLLKFGSADVVTLRPRVGEQREVVLDWSKAVRMLGWTPKAKLFDKIGEIFDEFRRSAK